MMILPFMFYKRSPRKVVSCVACGKDITFGVYFYDKQDPDRVFCLKCKMSGAKCPCCKLPVHAQNSAIVDERLVCKECAHDGIFDPETLEKVLQFTKKTFRAVIGVVPLKIKAHFVWKEKMGSVAREYGFSSNGKCAPGFCYRTPYNSGIYLLKGLKPNVLLPTIFHETGHLVSCMRKSQLLEDGFAEWCAWKCLDFIGAWKPLEWIEERRDRYGKGFQIVENYERKRGKTWVVHFFCAE